MDNQELLNQLKESVNKHDEIIAQEKINAAVKERQEQQEKQQKEIEELKKRRESDKKIVSAFKEFLPKAVENGCFKNKKGKKIVTGYIDFRAVASRTKSINGEFYITGVYFCCDGRRYFEHCYFETSAEYPNGQEEQLKWPTFRGLFRKEVVKPDKIRNIKATILGESMRDYTYTVEEIDIEEVNAFKNLFNSELDGVAHITGHNYREIDNRAQYFASTDNERHYYFYFEAEF